MQIPLFMFYSKFSCGCHTNPELAILRDFAEGFIDMLYKLAEAIGKRFLRKNCFEKFRTMHKKTRLSESAFKFRRFPMKLAKFPKYLFYRA